MEHGHALLPNVGSRQVCQHVGIFEDLAAIPDCAHHVAGPVVDFVLPAVLKLNSVARLPLPRDI